MQIPEGFSVPWDESLCKRALEDQCTFSNDVANRWHSCIAARSWESLLFKHSRPPGRRLSVRHPLRHQPATTAL